jgi:hypothetical protein
MLPPYPPSYTFSPHPILPLPLVSTPLNKTCSDLLFSIFVKKKKDIVV